MGPACPSGARTAAPSYDDLVFPARAPYTPFGPIIAEGETTSTSGRKRAVKHTRMGTLAALVVASAVAASSPSDAAARAYLRASVSCSSSGACTARAFGGTGLYEDWEWSLAYEDFDGGGSWSTADASQFCVSGMMLGVSATVTDSSGATAGGSAWVFCP